MGHFPILTLLFAAVSLTLSGCGTTRESTATHQLILSDAVDRSVSHIDFTPLADEKVFLDTQFIPTSKTGAVNTEYIISSLRQQMLLARCLLQDSAEKADFVVEARLGAIGQDGHDLNIGLPANNTLNTAASLVSSAPPLPALPEISLGRRTVDSAAAKIAVFAYHRETKQPVWQSGLSVGRSSARNRWVMGAGPFQSGEIYNGTRFAGGKINSLFSKPDLEPSLHEQAYRSAAVFDEKLRRKRLAGIQDNGAGDLAADSQPNPAKTPAEGEPGSREQHGSDLRLARRQNETDDSQPQAQQPPAD